MIKFKFNKILKYTATIIIMLVVSMPRSYAQVATVSDSIAPILNTANGQFHYRQLIVPGILISYGFAGLNTHWLKGLNHDIRKKVHGNIDQKMTIDDFSRYVPVASVYALNVIGIEGKNTLRDRTIIMATSFIIVNTTVLALKSSISAQRPDGSSNNSFPSGHTATAFAGAEFLWQEYKDVSIWYGVGGYIIATGTGIFRIYNDRHWFTDVAAGAGIGILGTKAAYWLNPYLKRQILGKGEKDIGFMVTPFYDGRHTGCSIAMQF